MQDKWEIVLENVSISEYIAQQNAPPAEKKIAIKPPKLSASPLDTWNYCFF